MRDVRIRGSGGAPGLSGRVMHREHRRTADPYMCVIGDMLLPGSAIPKR